MTQKQMYYSSVLPEEVKQDHFPTVRSAQALLHRLLDCVLTDCVVQLVVDRVITSVCCCPPEHGTVSLSCGPERKLAAIDLCIVY